MRPQSPSGAAGGPVPVGGCLVAGSAEGRPAACCSPSRGMRWGATRRSSEQRRSSQSRQQGIANRDGEHSPRLRGQHRRLMTPRADRTSRFRRPLDPRRSHEARHGIQALNPALAVNWILRHDRRLGQREHRHAFVGGNHDALPTSCERILFRHMYNVGPT